MSTYPRVKPLTEYNMKYICDTDIFGLYWDVCKYWLTDPASPSQLRQYVTGYVFLTGNLKGYDF